MATDLAPATFNRVDPLPFLVVAVPVGERRIHAVAITVYRIHRGVRQHLHTQVDCVDVSTRASLVATA